MGNPADPKIRFTLSSTELRALATLVEDQLFRLKFIDPKIPGHKNDPEQMRAAESALATLKESLQAKKAIVSTFHSPLVRKPS
ncbi:MAG TPA: hypothetical protein VEX68_04290 [Bryobacteraceae bacterium]|nr:hypothetical protein [Bryobacteraceae bacterium]